MSKKYLTVYNLSREKDWVLKNAFDIIETQEINTVWQLEFSIPMNDQDQQHCQPYWYVRYGDDGQLYRFTEQVKTNADTSTVTYHCEHVIATLSDGIMFQGPYYEGGINHFTAEVLGNILEKQPKENGVRNWALGTCEPRRQFEYSWENENLLAALFSVPNCFGTPYMWTYDTTSFPWKVNLVEIHEDADPDFYLMAKKNILRSEESSSNLEICTRLYGLGEGEGVNQLTIKSVNNGLPYIQSSPEKIAEYGIVSRIFVDRRYQYPETLKARMETLLHELETPSLTREFDIVDLHDISPDDMYKAEVGRICLLKDDDTKVYITKTVKNWSVPGDMKITIATKATDISTSIADLADRQRIEQVYSQGASQVYSFNFSGNATDQYPLNGYVYFPDDLKYLNEVKLKVKLNPFRSYSKSKSAYFDGGTQSTEKDGGTKNFTTNEDGGTKDFETNEDGGTKNFMTNEDGGTKNFMTNEDGGTTGLETVAGGKVDTESGEGGAQEGETSVASGGGGISLGNVSIDISGLSISVDETSQANWTNPQNLGVKTSLIKYNNADYETEGALSINDKGHTHPVGYSGHVSYATPAAAASYRHTHFLNEGDTPSVSMWTNEPSNWFPSITDSDGHKHSISKADLQHSHSADFSGSASGKVTVNNNEGGGQTGFSHSHNFKIKAHTHKFSMPDHTHTFDMPDHEHKFDLPGHEHKFDLPGHKHKFNIPDHQHNIKIGQHQHDIEPGIFTSGNPTQADLIINGTKKATITTASTEMDITEYLKKDGKVPRGEWIEIRIKPTNAAPNNMAYISVFGNVFAFIQSYTGGNF